MPSDALPPVPGPGEVVSVDWRDLPAYREKLRQAGLRLGAGIAYPGVREWGEWVRRHQVAHLRPSDERGVVFVAVPVDGDRPKPGSAAEGEGTGKVSKGSNATKER